MAITPRARRIDQHEIEIAMQLAMLKAIVPIEIAIDKIEASWKLGQHKTAADQYEVARMLEWRGDWNGQALAQVMKERFSALAAVAEKSAEAA